MSEHTKRQTDEVELTPGTMTGLLKMGLIEKQRPVDRLLDRLLEVDGADWFSEVIKEEPFITVFADPKTMCEGVVERLELKSLKSKGKRMCAPERGPEDRLRGTLAYMLSVAAGLVHRDEYMSSQPTSVIEPVLVDRSASVPEPWSGLFAAAGRVAGSLDGAG